MLPSANHGSFLFALVLGLLVSGVLTPAVLDPSAEDESWGRADAAAAAPSGSPTRLSLPAAPTAEISAAEKESSQLLTKDLVPIEVVPSFVLGPGSGNILSLDESEPGRFFLALPNGTVYFMNRSKPKWKLLMGQPLSYSWRSPLIDDPQYILYSDHNGELFEYIKDGVVRKHNWTVEEYVQRAPVVEGPVITTGTKTSTFYVVDADNGELIYSDKEPFSWATAGMRGAEGQSVASKLESGDATYITIVRTDYFLDSYEINNHLWSVMVSRISAYNVGPGLPPTREEEMEITSRPGGNIPVYFPQDSDQAPLRKLMLPYAPDAQNPGMWSGQDKELASECESVNNCSFEMVRISKIDYREILVKLDNRFSSSPDLPGQPIGCPLGNCVVAKPNFPVSHHNAVNSRPTTNKSQNSLVDPNKYLVDGNYAVQNNLWLFMQYIYQHHRWILLPFMLILSIFCYLGLTKLFKYNKESDDLKERQTVQSKKRKPRKAGNPRSAGSTDNDKHILSNRENAENNGHSEIQGSSSYSYINLMKPDDGIDGRWVGRLFVKNSEIGRGSNGTVVFEGIYDGRPVAVKRLLRAHHDVAFKEIQNLIASDRHPNIVRWYGVEQDLDFVYISLERCICSLCDLILITSDSSSQSISVENPTSNSVIGHKVQMHLVEGVGKDFSLWRANGLPSPQLLNLMRDVVSGLAHLHELGIIHRDLKPQNVLISHDRHLNAKLSDMGISKRLLEDMSSLSRNTTGYGSSGWQAPEQLLHGRQTRAVDLFSLGCILFFCLTKGKHPFGNHFERDANIINNRMDLFLVNDIPEAEHLLCQLLHPDPQMRLSAVEVLHHPLFWSSESRLSFLRDASDRVELEDRENESNFLKALENHASVAFGGKWDEKLDAAFISDMGRYRKYRFDSVRDLLRVIRNKLNHYRELPRELQESLGPVPEGFDMYFTSRFPNLLVEVYKVLSKYCKEEVSFSKYFQSSHL